jgi:hypothetical protein
MSPNLRRVLLGVVFVGVVTGGLWLIAAGPASDRDVSNLGSDTFDSLRPSNVARAAAEGPVFFPDPLGEGRDIYITHAGGDLDEGFVAFSAVNDDTGCLLQYEPDTDDLMDTCDGSRHPADGSTQLRYPVEVRDDRLIIDLNFRERDQAPQGADEGEP